MKRAMSFLFFHIVGMIFLFYDIVGLSRENFVSCAGFGLPLLMSNQGGIPIHFCKASSVR